MSTTTLDFGGSPPWQRWMLVGGIALSVGLHVLIARYAFPDGAAPEKADTWVEMTVVQPPPPPPVQEVVVEPLPPPEAPKPKPKPKPVPEKVEFKDTTKQPQPEDAPPTKKPVRRVVGLSASSFAEGSGNGVSARAGTTLGSGSKTDTMSIEEAATSVAYGAVTTRPKCSQPPLEVPESVIEAEVEGQVKIVFDVDGTGKVRNVRVTRKLHPGADAACVSAWTQARCKPGQQGSDAVTVTNMPYYCTFKAIN